MYPLRSINSLKINFVATWFTTTVITLILSIVLIFYLSSVKVIQPINQNFKLYAAIPESGMVVSENIEKADARAKIIENFFRGYKSLLSGFANTFVQVADKYNLDWRLLPAISMQESNGGQKVINDSHNPFGYGIYGSLILRFSTWDDAIERVGRALREDYLNKGLTTPETIMTKYTPPSLAKGGSWAIGVSSFMEELR